MKPTQSLVPITKRGTGTVGPVVAPSMKGFSRFFANRPDMDDADQQKDDVEALGMMLLGGLVGICVFLYGLILLLSQPAIGGPLLGLAVTYGVGKVALNRHNADRRIAWHDVPKGEARRKHGKAIDAAQRIVVAVRSIDDDDLLPVRSTERAAADDLWLYADCLRRADRLEATLADLNTGSDTDYAKFAEGKDAIAAARKLAEAAYSRLFVLRDNAERLAKTVDTRRQTIGFEAEAILKKVAAENAYAAPSVALADRANLMDREIGPMSLH